MALCCSCAFRDCKLDGLLSALGDMALPCAALMTAGIFVAASTGCLMYTPFAGFTGGDTALLLPFATTPLSCIVQSHMSLQTGPSSKAWPRHHDAKQHQSHSASKHCMAFNTICSLPVIDMQSPDTL